MKKRNLSIPVNKLPQNFEAGIAVGNIEQEKGHFIDEANRSHRHDYHFFLLIKQGQVEIEVDFENENVKAPALLYLHPNQVHRIVNGEADISFLGMSNETIDSNFLKDLEKISMARAIGIDNEALETALQFLNLCERILQHKRDSYQHQILRHCGNAFLGLTLSQYREQEPVFETLPRYEQISKSFMLLLEEHFLILKRPSDYADLMNLSTPYLNESIRNATGFSVSYHIQQRIILEAKRLLYFSEKTVKEIGFELGFEDHTYFSRYFRQRVGQSPLAFRKKYLD